MANNYMDCPIHFNGVIKTLSLLEGDIRNDANTFKDDSND